MTDTPIYDELLAEADGQPDSEPVAADTTPEDGDNQPANPGGEQ